VKCPTPSDRQEVAQLDQGLFLRFQVVRGGGRNVGVAQHFLGGIDPEPGCNEASVFFAKRMERLRARHAVAAQPGNQLIEYRVGTLVGIMFTRSRPHVGFNYKPPLRRAW
jgi:hypothetical protein